MECRLVFQRRAPADHGLAAFCVFTTSVHSSILSALLTFPGTAWCSACQRAALAWGLTPLAARPLGGLIKWIPGGLIYLAVTLWLMVDWLQGPEREALRTGAHPHSLR